MKYELRLVGLAVMLTALTACGQQREFPDAPPYREHPNGEFPITASYAFYTPYISDEQFEWVKEAGFNNLQKSLSEEMTDTLLKYAARYDIPMFVSIPGMRDGTRTREVAEKYKDNPLVWGYSIFDEPVASQFDMLREVSDKVKKYSPDQNVFINLLPSMDPEHLGTRDYRQYVEEFVAVVNPPFISYDVYPIKKTKAGKIYVDPIFYETMEVVSDVARRSGRPFWNYVLSNSHWMYPKPTLNYLRFQIFSALGYGSQGIDYYTYLMPDFDKGKGEYSDAPIDWDGRRTDVWYMARDVNREVKALEKVFLGAEVVDVAHTGASIPRGTHRLERLPAPFTVIDSNGEGLMVSHLRNGEKEYLMVVNRNVEKKQKVYLGRTRPVKRLYGDGKEKMESGKNFTLDPGGYALYEIK